MMFGIQPGCPAPTAWRVGLLVLSVLPWCSIACGREKSKGSAAEEELQIRWEYYQTVEPPAASEAELVDVILGPGVFTEARIDLGDLRLYDDSDQPVPYALRVLRRDYRRDRFEADEFNRAEGGGNSSELTLDLKRDDIEHNEVEIATAGDNFRRKVELEGSDDGKAWSTLATTNLIRFGRSDEKIDGNTVTYPPSRFRYLRVRLFPDPVVDKGRVAIASVNVVRKVEVPGEVLTLDAALEPRQAVRADGAPGSAWIIDLGGDKIPCEKIEIEIADVEFARNYYIEWAGPPDSRQRFQRVSLTSEQVWQRRAGEAKRPMEATFHEVRASRLKLVVIDHQNPPLDLGSVKFSAAARQCVFTRPEDTNAGQRIFFGNPQAEPPNYDFARNLPARLVPAPARGKFGQRQVNPRFIPPPKPLTERWPWLVYVVLGTVSLVLGLIILSLARTVIRSHDHGNQVGISA